MTETITQLHFLHQMHRKTEPGMRRLFILPMLAATALLLSGCGNMTSTAPPMVTSAAGLTGTSYGGRQPIVGATISLYQTGTTGYGAGASMVTPSVITDGNGKFTFPAFTCTAGTQIYVVSNGGDPYGNGENNVAATLMAGLTSCNNIANMSKVSMNEVTTIGTVWSLAQFMTDTNVGAPATNQAGLANAFLDVATLVNTTTGMSPGANLAANTAVPSAEINTLANVLVSCVNSVDNSSTTSLGCSNLFGYATPSGGPAPSDTVGAAINIAKNPGANVAQIIAASGVIQAYMPAIATANDFTIGIQYSGIPTPSAVAADAGGNIWITNGTANTVTELSHSGAPLVGSPYNTGALSTPAALAIDTAGNAWIANSGNSTVTELTSSGANATNSPFSGGGLAKPISVAIDGFGNIWLANSRSNSASEFSSTGVALSGTTGYVATGLAAPVAVAVNPH